MKFKISLFIEDEDENIIFDMGTDAGMDDFEENIIRKGKHAMDEYVGQLEAQAELDLERAKENKEYFEEVYTATDYKGGKKLVDQEANNMQPY